PAAP
ncbi:hypothetical protein BN1723_020389, partial [Verticillium longisporum]